MALWTWQPSVPPDAARKATLLAGATGGGALVCIAIGVVTSARAMLVIGVMLASIFALGRLSSRQLQSLRVTVDDGGILTLADSRETTRIDLPSMDSVEVRARNDIRANRRLTVEAVGAGTVVSHRIASIEGYWALPDEAVTELRRGIEHYHGWYRGQRPATAAEPAPAAATPAITAAPTAASPWEWRPPRVPNADRNRRRILIITIAIALVISAIGVANTWGDVVGVILSATVVPTMVLLLGLGLWFAYVPGMRYRLVVADGVLRAMRGDKVTSTVPLAGASDVVVDTMTSTNMASGTHTRSTHTYIRVDHAGGTDRLVVPTSMGINVNADERLMLETSLRHLAGLR